MLSTRLLRALSQPARSASATLARRPTSQSTARLAANALPPTDIHNSLRQVSGNDKRNYIIDSRSATIKNLLAEKFGVPYHQLLLTLASQADVWAHSGKDELFDICFVYYTAICKLDAAHRLDFVRKIPLDVRTILVRESLYPPHQHYTMEGGNLKAFPEADRLEVFNMTEWDKNFDINFHELKIHWRSVFLVLSEDQADKLASQLGQALAKIRCDQSDYYGLKIINLLAAMSTNQRGILLEQLSAQHLQQAVMAWDKWFAEDKLQRKNSFDIHWHSKTEYELDDNQQAALTLLREVAASRENENRCRRSP